MMLEAICMVICAVASDVFWALYIRNIADKNKRSAATYGVLIGFCYLISLKIMVDDSFWYGIFHLIGLWLGTYYHEEIEQIAHKKFQSLKAKFTSQKK